MQTRKQTLNKLRESSSVNLDRLKTDVQASDWSRERIFIAAVISDKIFEIVLSLMVLFSIFIGILEADHKAQDEEVPHWIQPTEHVLLVLYCVEMSLRLYVLRRQFFESALNVFDLIVVVVDAIFALIRLTSVELPQIAFLRILRLMRLSRALHILASQPQLWMFAEAFAAAMKTILFGCVFIAVALVIHGILAVEFLYPLQVEFSATCVRCPTAFQSVYESMCTLFQTVIIGDEWAEVFRPYLATHPETLLLIFPQFIILHLGLLNLIMAVVVDSAHQSRLTNVKRLADQKEAEFHHNQKRLSCMCREMDRDGSGTLTVDELLNGYENHMEFKRTLNAMDIKEDDLMAVFGILDKDSSGDIEYEEFVQQLHKMRASDSHTMLVFIKHYVTELRKQVTEEMVLMKKHIVGGIQKLQEKVGEEMMMLKDTAAMNASALEASDKRLEDTLNKENEILLREEQLLKEDIGLHRQMMGQEPPAMAFPIAVSVANGNTATSAVDLGDCSQLQIASEKMRAQLEELKRKCEQSATLLTTFSTLLPRATGVQELSLLRGAAHGDASQLFHEGVKEDPPGLWKLQSCCSPSLKPQTRPGLPSPTQSGHDRGLLDKPPESKTVESLLALPNGASSIIDGRHT